MEAASKIHGATKENVSPSLIGLYDTITSKFNKKGVVECIQSGKTSVVNALIDNTLEERSKSYYKSHDNVLRSLNTYYSHNVMGKQKYIGIRKSNRQSKTNPSHLVVNYVPYSLLSTTINSIDIGTIQTFEPTLTYNLDGDDIPSWLL